MYKSILVPLDHSTLAEKILPDVEALARLMNAKLHLVCVGKAVVMPGIERTEAQARVVKAARQYLEKIREQLAAKNVEVEIHTPHGNAAENILNVGKQNQVELIAMSTHGRSGLGRWLIGSVADKVVRHSEIPVLLLRPGKLDA